MFLGPDIFPLGADGTERANGLGHKRDSAKPFRFHDLRHTFGTLCASSGVPVGEIRVYMGHASLSTTDVYMHFAPKHDAAAAYSRVRGIRDCIRRADIIGRMTDQDKAAGSLPDPSHDVPLEEIRKGFAVLPTTPAEPIDLTGPIGGMPPAQPAESAPPPPPPPDPPE